MADHPDRPGYSFDPGPPPEASAFFRHKGLRVSFGFEDVEPEEHAVAFTVAKMMQIDLLADTRAAMLKAIEEGQTLDQFRRTLKPRLEAAGWWGRKAMVDPLDGETKEVQLGSPRRLRTIYQANLRSAQSAGQWSRIERTKALMPYLEYRLGPSERHRPHHADKEGKVLAVDDPFWDAWMPPNGWGCKCWVKQISAAEARSKGVIRNPHVPLREVVNKRTGEVKRVPQGIDPGWERNPGKLRLQTVARQFADRWEAIPPDARETAARDMLQSWGVARMIERGVTLAAAGVDPFTAPRMTVPVASLPNDAIAASGASVRGVLLSAATTVKQALHHPDLAAGDYERLIGLLDGGEVLKQSRALIFIERASELPYIAVVKVLAPQRENFITSFYRAGSARYITRLRAKPGTVLVRP